MDSERPVFPAGSCPATVTIGSPSLTAMHDDVTGAFKTGTCIIASPGIRLAFAQFDLPWLSTVIPQSMGYESKSL
jgi:hypothetical protein